MNVTGEESNSDNMPAYIFCLFLGEGAQDDKKWGGGKRKEWGRGKRKEWGGYDKEGILI